MNPEAAAGWACSTLSLARIRGMDMDGQFDLCDKATRDCLSAWHVCIIDYEPYCVDLRDAARTGAFSIVTSSAA